MQNNSSRIYLRKILGVFSGNQLNRLCCQYYCTAFETYVRLFSYNVHYSLELVPLFDIFDNYNLVEPRCSNDIALPLFKISEYNECNMPISFVLSLENYIGNLYNRFAYKEWYQYINFNLFVLAGKFD